MSSCIGASTRRERGRKRWAMAAVWACWTLLAAAAAPGLAAQPSAPEEHPEEQPERASSAVVFLIPQTLDASLATTLGEALRAQLAGIRARLVMMATGIESPGLKQLVKQGEVLARQEEAVGVFFLDARRDEQWLLYLVDPKSERVLVRRAGGSLESLAAAIETVAVITGAAAAALSAEPAAAAQMASAPSEGAEARGTGEEHLDRWVQVAVPKTLDAQPPKAEEGDEEQPPVVLPEQVAKPPSAEPRDSDLVCENCSPDWGQLRLAVALRSGAFAEQKDWQVGAGLWGGWISSLGLYAGIGYFLVSEEDVEENVTARETGSFVLKRHPIEVFAGYRYGMGHFALDGELAAVFDILSRGKETVEVAVGGQSVLEETQGEMRLAFGLLPRVRVEYAALEPLAVFAGAGLPILLRGYEYVAKLEGEQPEVLLSPNLVRLDVEVGLAFRIGSASRPLTGARPKGKDVQPRK